LAWKKVDTSERARQLSDPQLRDSLLRMFNKPYWSRLWIVQEVFLAKDILVLDGCGLCWWKDIFRWFRFLEVFAFQNKDGVLRKSALDPMFTSPARRLVSNWVEWKESRNGYPLHQLLIMWPDQDCEDVRDKVFGVLGLMNSQHSKAFLAD
jgi:hypothetical protein